MDEYMQVSVILKGICGITFIRTEVLDIS